MIEIEKFNNVERYDDGDTDREVYYSEIISDIEKVVTFDELTADQKHTIFNKVCGSLINISDIFYLMKMKK